NEHRCRGPEPAGGRGHPRARAADHHRPTRRARQRDRAGAWRPAQNHSRDRGREERAAGGVSEPIRVFLCDDVPELRTLLRFALEEAADVRVVGEAGAAATGIERVGELQPDVLLLDLSMPGLDGLEAIPLLKEAAPDLGIIVFSGFAADRMRDPALALGADRYLEKGEPLEVVRDAVREVALAA